MEKSTFGTNTDQLRVFLHNRKKKRPAVRQAAVKPRVLIIRTRSLQDVGGDEVHAPLHQIGGALGPVAGPDVDQYTAAVDALHQLLGGSEDMDIVGVKEDGTTVQIFKNGNWAF